MARQIRYGRMISSALIGLLLVSCGTDSGNPASPTGPSGGVQTPATILRIDVSAPESIPPGESAQLTATAVKSDGSTENVTTSAVWSSSNTRVIQIGGDARATAVNVGEATVQARFQSRTGGRLVLAVPAGTHKVFGRITEGELPLQGVSLRVIRGAGEGLSTTSDFSGRFALYGVAGEVRIQASKPGYLDTFRDLSVGSTVTDNFELAPARERKNLAGTYELTVEASTCAGSSNFPNELRSRTYTANVTQSGQALKVTLGGATFIVSSGMGDRFSGSIDPLETVVFRIGDPYFYYYYYFPSTFEVVERIDDSRSFTLAGIVTATVRGSEIAGTLNGSFIVLSGTQPPFRQFMSTCNSSSHTFVMRPR